MTLDFWRHCNPVHNINGSQFQTAAEDPTALDINGRSGKICGSTSGQKGWVYEMTLVSLWYLFASVCDIVPIIKFISTRRTVILAAIIQIGHIVHTRHQIFHKRIKRPGAVGRFRGMDVVEWVVAWIDRATWEENIMITYVRVYKVREKKEGKEKGGDPENAWWVTILGITVFLFGGFLFSYLHFGFRSSQCYNEDKVIRNRSFLLVRRTYAKYGLLGGGGESGAGEVEFFRGR